MLLRSSLLLYLPLHRRSLIIIVCGILCDHYHNDLIPSLMALFLYSLSILLLYIHCPGGYVCCLLLKQPIVGFGVAKVVDSGNPDFKIGDYVWGMTRWEEYSLITSAEKVMSTWERSLLTLPENLFKIKYTDIPLSYYTGILGELFILLDMIPCMLFLITLVVQENELQKTILYCLISITGTTLHQCF